MFIERGCVGQGRLRERSEDVLLESFFLEQDRICGVMLCMCIDRGCFGTGENGGV